MARTKEFDPDVALEIAVEVFWRLGYEHTSLDTLMREMRISKQSLYDTFGDKRSIYFRAMSHYRGKTNASLRSLFATRCKP
jgi:TetR/AcrR family transcriptional repressor of nem operon